MPISTKEELWSIEYTPEVVVVCLVVCYQVLGFGIRDSHKEVQVVRNSHSIIEYKVQPIRFLVVNTCNSDLYTLSVIHQKIITDKIVVQDWQARTVRLEDNKCEAQARSTSSSAPCRKLRQMERNTSPMIETARVA